PGPYRGAREESVILESAVGTHTPRMPQFRRQAEGGIQGQVLKIENTEPWASRLSSTRYVGNMRSDSIGATGEDGNAELRSGLAASNFLFSRPVPDLRNKYEGAKPRN